MNKIKAIKKFKAYFIKLKLHRLFGFLAEPIIYLGYLLRLSKWVDKNKDSLQYNDFYNSKVKHKERENLYDWFLNKYELENTNISYLEFGVAGGSSLRWWCSKNNHENSTFWAFDTYEGLPEKYGIYKKGGFSQEGNFPDIKDDRIQFIKGLFQDTLLDVIPKIDFDKKLIIHLDADLYSATLYTLTILFPYLKKGDVLIFDEFGVPLHEFKAFEDFLKSFYIKLKPIGAINNYLQMVFEVE